MGKGAMLALGMGCGKSFVAIALILNFKFRRTLIVCPKSVVGVWPKQFRVHSDKEVLVVPLTKGTVAQKAEQAEMAFQKAEMLGVPCVLVINYESVWREPFASWALKSNIDCVVGDELHKCKQPGGKLSTYMGRLGQKVKYKLGLTGSPMPHSPLDAYAQYRFLDPTIFGTSFTRFRSRYAIMGGFQGHEIKGYQHEDELNEKFYSIAYRVGREAIELPEAIHETRTCVLEPSALKIYKELEHDCFTALREDTTITPANALTKLLRLQQVTSGVVKDDDGVLQEVSKAKGELLADIMEDLPTHEPVVVFARFQADLDTIRRVCEEQGRKYGELSGRARDGLTSDSTMSPDIDVIGVQIQSGGVGIDLTRAAYCIYLSLGYSLGDYEQSLARCHRPGQTRTTFFYHLITEGTVDEKVYKALDERRDVVESILKEVRG